MNHNTLPTMLPSGLYDLLPDQTLIEQHLINQLMKYYVSCGYLPVQPPLLEYENTLLPQDSALAKRCFRVMDPLSQQMMGLRADMTLQVARIAASQLAGQPRPLRLCYSGLTVRTLPDTLRSTRQFRQIGIEYFGSEALCADIEVMQLAVASLQQAGIDQLSLDLCLPEWLPLLLQDVPAEDHVAILDAIRHKDSGQLKRLDQPLLEALCHAIGPAEAVLAKLQTLTLPDSLLPAFERLQHACEMLQARLDNQLTLTIDPLEMRGFGYHQGLSFALYHIPTQSELGRGGRYISHAGEAATGFTLYAEDVLPLLSLPRLGETVLLPADTSEQMAACWRAEGFRTLYANEQSNQQTDWVLDTETNSLKEGHK